MASFNKVILVGNITRTPELRQTPSGLSVTDIGLAVNSRRKTASGESIDEVTFVDITLWGREAEVVCEYTSKGSPILVEGRLKQESWESEGQRRTKMKVIAERIQLLGSRSGGNEEGSDYVSRRVNRGSGGGEDSSYVARQNPRHSATSSSSPPQQQYAYYDTQDGDEVPF